MKYQRFSVKLEKLLPIWGITRTEFDSIFSQFDFEFEQSEIRFLAQLYRWSKIKEKIRTESSVRMYRITDWLKSSKQNFISKKVYIQIISNVKLDIRKTEKTLKFLMSFLISKLHSVCYISILKIFKTIFFYGFKKKSSNIC